MTELSTNDTPETLPEIPEEPSLPLEPEKTDEVAPKFVYGKKGLALLIILALVGGAGYEATVLYQNQQLALTNKIADLQLEVTHLKSNVNTNEQTASAAAAQISHIQEIHAKSQDQLLTDAVGKVSAAVVSIVISKDVPNLTVVYENPFGNDPFFKNFGVQVPVYQQNGTTHQKIGAGSGFLITSDGYILTNKHVVYDNTADYTVLLSNGKQQTAKVIYKDAINDIAIVKIEGSNFTHVGLSDSSSLKLGQTVIAIGNALGEYSNSVSVGIISGLDRSIQASGAGGSEQLTGVIQTDAAINPGNSGGPLLDLNGNVVGINVATVQGSSNISFSIPINIVKSIIKSVLNR